MAVLTTNVTTSTSDVEKTWRTIESKAYEGISFLTPELGWMQDLPKEDLEWSFRIVRIKYELNEVGGIAAIGEGGWKAQASSADLEEGAITMAYLSGRFTFTDWAELADAGQKNQIVKQIKLQAKQKTAAFAKKIGKMFWGSSTGILALTDTNISGTTATLTLHSAFGDTSITDATYIAGLFAIGDKIAVLEAGVLVEFGTVTAVTAATPSIGVTFAASVTNSNNNLQIVGAESLENTTLDGTDYNKWVPGMNDILKAAGVHSLTHDNHTVAYSNTAVGRFNGIKLRKSMQMVEDYGPTGHKVDQVIWDRGVELDAIDYERAGLRHTNPFQMEMDGQATSKGKTFVGSKNVPPGWVVPYSKKALGKMQLTPNINTNPDSPPAFKIMEYQDRTVKVAELRMLFGTVVRARKGFTYYTAQARQP